METEKLYYADPFLQEFTATVLSCEAAKGGFAVTLDRTAFYPEGGGQPGDGGLDRTGAEGKGDSVDGENHLVDAQPLGTDGPRKKDTIKKAQNPAEQAGQSEKHSSGNKRTFGHGGFLTEGLLLYL